MTLIYKLCSSLDEHLEPKYIGITSVSLEARFNQHFINMSNKNFPVYSWMKSVYNKGGEVLIFQIDHSHTLEEAKQKEMFYIDYFTNLGYKLKNATRGGDGGGHKRVKQFTKQGELVKVWECIMCAAKELKLSDPHITSCCKGKYGRKSVGGFVWRYEEDDFNKYEVAPINDTTKIALEQRKKIYQIDKNGEVVKVWNHSQEIENETNFRRSSISLVCRKVFSEKTNNLLSAYDYYWSYESNKDIVRSLVKAKMQEQVDNCNKNLAK